MKKINRALVVAVLVAIALVGGSLAAKGPKRIPPPTSSPAWAGTIPAEWGHLRSSSFTAGGIWNLVFESQDGTIRLMQMSLGSSEPVLSIAFERSSDMALNER